MTNRMKENLMKGIFFIFLFLALILQSIVTNAQSAKKTEYKGMEVNFGTRSFLLNSNIQGINQSNEIQGGGRINLIYGNHIFRTKIGFGYYSTVGNTAGTIDLYETGASLNFYPLSLLLKERPRLEPYLTAGIAYDNFKFYGHYINQEPGNINYSNIEAPYLGSVKQVNTTIGIGIEIKLIDHYDFIHLFSEVRYGHNLSARSENTEFNNTAINKQMQVNVGITFGAHR